MRETVVILKSRVELAFQVLLFIIFDLNMGEIKMHMNYRRREMSFVIKKSMNN